MDFRDALAIAFDDHAQNGFRLLNWQVHAVEGVVAGVRAHLAALGTFIALAHAEFAAFCPAGMTSQCEISP